MTKQSTIVRTDRLEQAIQTVIQDTRIPNNLRTILTLYQNRQAERNSHGISVVPPKSIGLSTASGLADGCRPNNSGNCEGGSTIDPGRTALEQGIQIYIWRNDDSLDWSVEINGRRHDYVTSEVMEALVECAVISVEASLMTAFSHRPQ